MIQVLTVPVGELQANCHIVFDQQHHAVIIDPGAEAEKLLALLKEHALHAKAILLTHAHFDHFAAAAPLMEALQIPLYLHRLEEPVLHSVQQNLADYLGMQEQYRNIAECCTFEEGDVLSFSEALTFTILHTPGHSPGSVCYCLDTLMFTGDTLFRDAVGRVDFPGGNLRDMRASLRRLGALEGDYQIYCGHYAGTTLAREKAYSHYLQTPASGKC
ncbi:MAG: MBL fold metallo-hydrolase [Oscillospiraceae bacterium]|nr:MBL fold metallo-hydrolase [Oscillospiraceae bacterium]